MDEGWHQWAQTIYIIKNQNSVEFTNFRMIKVNSPAVVIQVKC